MSKLGLDAPNNPIGSRPSSNADDSADAPNYDMDDSDDDLDPVVDAVDDDDDDDDDVNDDDGFLDDSGGDELDSGSS